MAKKGREDATVKAADLGVTGFFGGCDVSCGLVDRDAASQLMLARIAERDPDLASKCECCVALDLMLRVPVVPAMRNGTACDIRQHMDDGSVSCSIHQGRVSCCRAVQAWNEGVTGSPFRTKHELTFGP